MVTWLLCDDHRHNSNNRKPEENPHELLVNRPDALNFLPMDRACRGGHVEACRILKAHGAVAYVPAREVLNSLGQTSFHMACLGGNTGVCEFLWSEGGVPPGAVNECTWSGECTPLSLACEAGSVELCEWLLAHGAELDPEDPNPMCCACHHHGGKAVVEWLCEHGMAASVNLKDMVSFDSTPLHHAASRGHLEVVEFLYNHGAQACVTQPNRIGYTPLHLVCACQPQSTEECIRRAELLEWLCEHGGRACIDRAGQFSKTALTWACLNGNLAACEVLHHQGARDTFSGAFEWTSGFLLAPEVQLWAVDRYGAGMSDQAIAAPFMMCLAEAEADGEEKGPRWHRFTGAALAMLWIHGPRVVRDPLPAHAPGAIVEAAARVGVDQKLLVEHPRLWAVLEEAVQRRRAFERGFLFGCLSSSGSPPGGLRRALGSRHATARFRKRVAEYAGVVLRREEWGRVLRLRGSLVVVV